MWRVNCVQLALAFLFERRNAGSNALSWLENKHVISISVNRTLQHGVMPPDFVRAVVRASAKVHVLPSSENQSRCAKSEGQKKGKRGCGTRWAAGVNRKNYHGCIVYAKVAAQTFVSCGLNLDFLNEVLLRIAFCVASATLLCMQTCWNACGDQRVHCSRPDPPADGVRRQVTPK